MPITDDEIAELSARGYAAVLRKSVTLTDAQIKALPTTSVEIVAAPGANKIIFPLFLMARIDWHADYTNIDVGSIMQFVNLTNPLLNELSNENGDLGLFLAGGGPDGIWAMSAHRQRFQTNLLRTLAGYYDSDIGNAAISLVLNNNGAGNLTGGNASNTMKVTVVYVLIDY